jgi:hypothetical protein
MTYTIDKYVYILSKVWELVSGLREKAPISYSTSFSILHIEMDKRRCISDLSSVWCLRVMKK